MLNQIRRAVFGEPVAPPPLQTPGFRGAHLPPEDLDPAPPPPEIAPLDPVDSVLDGLVNRPFVIVYTDAQGQGSERRIVTREVYRAGGQVYLKAVCLERSAPRTFRVDRIREVYCGVTGEDLGRADRVFVPWAERDVPRPSRGDPGPGDGVILRAPSPSQIAVRFAVRVLMTVARSDGDVHPGEMAVVERFLDAAGADSEAERADVLDFAFHQAPSPATFRQDFMMVASLARGALPHLIEAVGEVVAADGVLAEEESELMAHLLVLAEEAALKVNVVVDD